MIKNILTLIFFILLVGSMGTFVVSIAQDSADFKKGLEQHLLRNQP